MPNTIQTKYINNVNMFIDGQNAYVIVEYFRTAGNLSSIEFGRRSKEDTLKFYNGLISAIYDGTEEVELFEGEEIKDVYVPEIEVEPEPEPIEEPETKPVEEPVSEPEPVVKEEPVQNEYGVFVGKDGSYYNEAGEATDEYGHLLDEEGNIMQE